MHLDVDRPEEVPIRDAATVMLVRDGVDGVEVFMLRRNLNSDFVGGAYVFPGGGVDAGDGAAEVGDVCVGRADDDASALLGIESGGLEPFDHLGHVAAGQPRAGGEAERFAGQPRAPQGGPLADAIGARRIVAQGPGRISRAFGGQEIDQVAAPDQAGHGVPHAADDHLARPAAADRCR